ncbi:MAG: cbb3-type cytochrome c oxidase N-terminal domain-containing protein [Phycisphaerales bacterium JB040]
MPETKLPKIIRYEDYRRAHPPKVEPRPRPVPSRSLRAHPNGPAHGAPAHAAPAPAPVGTLPDELTSHNYDGIQEYDNPTPGWWYLIFLATIVFSVMYAFIYHMGGAVPMPEERHARIEAAVLQERFAELSRLPMNEDKILAIMNQPTWLANGEAIFQRTCAICHSSDGSGLVGPNLTDDVYKNVTTLMDIPGFVSDGIGAAMPAQKNNLNENEIALVAAYAASLRGQDLETNPGVLPEYRTGQAIAPWPEPSEADPNG